MPRHLQAQTDCTSCRHARGSCILLLPNVDWTVCNKYKWTRHLNRDLVSILMLAALHRITMHGCVRAPCAMGPGPRTCVQQHQAGARVTPASTGKQCAPSKCRCRSDQLHFAVTIRLSTIQTPCSLRVLAAVCTLTTYEHCCRIRAGELMITACRHLLIKAIPSTLHAHGAVVCGIAWATCNNWCSTSEITSYSAVHCWRLVGTPLSCRLHIVNHSCRDGWRCTLDPAR